MPGRCGRPRRRKQGADRRKQPRRGQTGLWSVGTRYTLFTERGPIPHGRSPALGTTTCDGRASMRWEWLRRAVRRGPLLLVPVALVASACGTRIPRDKALAMTAVRGAAAGAGQTSSTGEVDHGAPAGGGGGPTGPPRGRPGGGGGRAGPPRGGRRPLVQERRRTPPAAAR